MTTSLIIPPGLILTLGGLMLPLFRGSVRPAVILLLPVVVLFMIWQVPDGPVMTGTILLFLFPGVPFGLSTMLTGP